MKAIVGNVLQEVSSCIRHPAADGGMSCECADGRMMQIWEVPTEETFQLAAAGEGYRLTLLPDT